MFFIYRNLHHGLSFSIRERGKVIDRISDFEAKNVKFKVNESGRKRVIKDGCKNVHAFITTSDYSLDSTFSAKSLARITYNPYKNPFFIVNNLPIFEAEKVIFTGGHCYIEL